VLTKADISKHFRSPIQLPSHGTIHLVGIGGAGMSPLARILIERGFSVSGSDLRHSRTTAALDAIGVDVWIGEQKDRIKNAALVVVSDAIDPNENPEFQEAKRIGIPVARRSQLLARILENRRVVAVAGTHGKSTATAFLGQLLAHAGFDPLTIVGAEVPGFDCGVRFGEGEWAVVEACEAFNGMLDISAETVLLTNLEPDHLEFHGDFAALQRSMIEFISNTTGKTKLIACAEDKGSSAIAAIVPSSIQYGFGIGGLDAAYDGSLRIKNVPIQMNTIGRHNALNMLGAMTAAMLLGADEQRLIAAVPQVKGCRRRLEIIAEQNGVLMVEDYAHHPSEIAASRTALREAYPDRRLVVVYQPLTYARVQQQLPEFVHELAQFDKPILTDIFDSRDHPAPGVSSARIVEGLESLGIEVEYVPSIHRLPTKVAKIVQPGDLLLDTGAGATGGFITKLRAEMDRADEPIRIAVLCGGESAEREVSKLGGWLFTTALRHAGFNANQLDLTEQMLGRGGLTDLIGRNRPDLVVPLLHGPMDEDGHPQAVLDLLGIPFVGSGVHAAVTALDKHASKQILAAHGLKVAEGVLLKAGEPVPAVSLPVVVKPNSQGSTIGMGIARTEQELDAAVRKAFRYDDRVLIEPLIQGTEVTVAVLGTEALPVVEIVPKSGFYDFQAKYTPGATDEICPARISESLTERCQKIALAAHQTLGCEDISRTDMMICDDSVIVLELNTMPGMTPTSLVPRSAAAAGMSYEQLCEKIVSIALERHGIAKKKKA